MPGSGPPLTLAMLEAKGLANLATSWVRPAVRVSGAGRGRPVIAIPGMLSGDETIRYLRRSLRASGFDAHASGILFHAVATPRSVALVEAQLDAVHARTGQKVALLGWSLGGLYARVIAQRFPDKVSGVLTLGTPFSGDPRANNAWKLYELMSGHPVSQSPFPEAADARLPVPSVAVWSARDGVISPESARGLPHECDRHVEVSASHLELASNGPCVRRVIEVLAELLD